MAIGIVPDGGLIDGSKVRPGDALIGVASSGVHSNGLTLGRSVVQRKFGFDEYVEELGTTIGEELLKPTRIYVAQVEALAKAGVQPRALAHITGDGLLNIRRIEAPCGFEHRLPAACAPDLRADPASSASSTRPRWPASSTWAWA